MLDTIFRGIFDNDLTSVISLGDFILCVFCSLIMGVILALFFMYRSRHSKSFAATLAILPAVVCVVIMMVNGNIGTGVAVAGAFSLVRFRSAPGSAKEIGAIFIAMGTGLVAGMGYLGYAFLCAVIFGLVSALYSHIGFGSAKSRDLYRTMQITIPEALNYTDVFDSILKEYTKEYELIQLKTSNMGSLFRLTYNITLKNPDTEKDMIDKLRCRNGNLEISVFRQETPIAEL